ncbi:MAG: hypothetical protein IPI66_13335 [Chitinophagaceae bacterium]|nr:hypothetical protein [Chitinophagaceae bacterium]
MNKRSASVLNSLVRVANHFDEESNRLKPVFLKTLQDSALPTGQRLLQYHDCLLFLCAYPNNAVTRKLAESALKKLASKLKKKDLPKKSIPDNEGLPFTVTLTRFSPEFLQWLLGHRDLDVEYDSFFEPTLSLNDILNITLPAVLKAETTAGLNNLELLEALGVKPNRYVPFLLGQLEALNDWPLLKELFMERMDLYVKHIPRNANFSRAFNRLPVQEAYYHHDLVKKFDHGSLLDTALPSFQIPERPERVQMVNVIRNAMALTVREIDPATFLQEETLRYYDLERGLRIAVYSMFPERQLPLETYFGFTFFKNGIPVSYGGVWAFGHLARLGLNIFEPFRGGESGYLLCQLMRVFKQAFGVNHFEIEPYQFGLDNPGGITSGAFWFYYKFGFRPVDPELKELAEEEYRKIKTRKDYRSSEKTLIRFTQGNIAHTLGNTVPQDVLDITGKILTGIKHEWPHNFRSARLKASQAFCEKVKLDPEGLNPIQKKVLEEMSLWAMAMKIRKPEQLVLMKEMVLTKTKDDYSYQQLLLAFFEQ